MNAKYLKVKVGVRYWQDADVNGQEDIHGKLIPFRNGAYWMPVINLELGTIENWPVGMTASIHYKVCDDGEYWLLDENKIRLAKWKDHYVPEAFLCFGDDGFGDYIIFNVDAAGKILGFKLPVIDEGEWSYMQTVSANLTAVEAKLLDLLKRITVFHSDPFPDDDIEELIQEAKELIAKIENKK